MDWFTDLFTQHSAIQAVVVLSLISVFGMMLGKVRFFGISLGVTFVFFIGIAAGHFGLSVDPSMLAFAESFGLVLFVYALGLQVGPGFFSSLRSGGIRLVSLATLIVLTGSALAVGLGSFKKYGHPVIAIVIGEMIIQLMFNGFVALGAPTTIQNVVTGVALLVIVALTTKPVKGLVVK